MLLALPWEHWYFDQYLRGEVLHTERLPFSQAERLTDVLGDLLTRLSGVEYVCSKGIWKNKGTTRAVYVVDPVPFFKWELKDAAIPEEAAAAIRTCHNNSRPYAEIFLSAEVLPRVRIRLQRSIADYVDRR